MIHTICVTAEYCFGAEPLRLENLGRVNFVFAPNGSGKTTISSALADQPEREEERDGWHVAPTRLPIRVFNEAYRSTVLAERVGGIFTMGAQSKEANDKIDALRDEKKERRTLRDAAKLQIGDDADPKNLTGHLGTLARERGLAYEAVFAAHKYQPRSVIEVVFKGLRNKVSKFGAAAIERYATCQDPAKGISWQSLEARASSLAGDSAQRTAIPTLSVACVLSDEDVVAVEKSSGTGGSGALAQLISSLGHEDWVNQGRAHYANAAGVCPFCQEPPQQDLESSLAEYFAAGFDDALAQAVAIESRATTLLTRLEGELKAIEDAVEIDPEVDPGPFNAKISTIRTAAALVASRLAEKSQHPTRAVDVSDIDQEASALTALISTTNAEISRHNELVTNAKEERKSLVDDGWDLFLSEPAVASAIKRFKGIDARVRDDIAKLQAEIEASQTADNDADKEIAALSASVSNTAEVAGRINALLEAMGFHRFKLEVADDVTGGYRITRNDGSPAVNSLSEGEKSFICFAYYWESLFGSSVSGGQPEEVIAVIDDPISSLDSDTLFIVAAFLRDTARNAANQSSTVRQLIVLTHNTQFHHEAAFTSSTPSLRDRHYFRLIKTPGGHTVVRDDGNRSRVTGTYPLLWQAVVEAARSDDESDLVRVGVVNVVRRIIEGYFKTIGEVPDFQRPGGLAPADERVVQMLHVWASAGSHTITDDIDQTLDVGGTKQFLRLLRRYFDLVDHSSHFEMMVRRCGGDDLLQEGAILARQASSPEGNLGLPRLWLTSEL